MRRSRPALAPHPTTQQQQPAADPTPASLLPSSSTPAADATAASHRAKRARPLVDGSRRAMAGANESHDQNGSGGGAAPPRLASSSAAAADAPGAPDAVGPRGIIRRSEYVRLLQQALAGLGHADLAAALGAATGAPAEGAPAAALRAAVEAGDWEGALAALPALGLGGAGRRARAAAYIILREQFLEALAGGDVGSALKVLRGRLAGVAPSPSALRALSSCLVAPPGVAGLAADTGGWPGPAAGSRAAALDALGDALPPGVLLPPARLETLVEQALDAQLASARFHNGPVPAPRSLFRDFVARPGGLPGAAAQVLTDHADEVWHVTFSPDGRLLASGGADGAAILWDVAEAGQGGLANGSAPGGGGGAPAGPAAPRLTKRATLRGHTGPVAVLAFSPDGATLASAGPDGSVRLWDTATGACAHTLTHHGALVTAVAWLPPVSGSPARLVSAGHDRTVHVLDPSSGASLFHWRSPRVADLAVVPGGRFLLTSSSERRVRVWDLGAGGVEVLLPSGGGGGGGDGGPGGGETPASAAAPSAPAAPPPRRAALGVGTAAGGAGAPPPPAARNAGGGAGSLPPRPPRPHPRPRVRSSRRRTPSFPSPCPRTAGPCCSTWRTRPYTSGMWGPRWTRWRPRRRPRTEVEGPARTGARAMPPPRPPPPPAPPSSCLRPPSPRRPARPWSTPAPYPRPAASSCGPPLAAPARASSWRARRTGGSTSSIAARATAWRP